jgi:peptidase M28-like protein
MTSFSPVLTGKNSGRFVNPRSARAPLACSDAVRVVIVSLWLLVVAPVVVAQLAPIKPPPGWPQVPSGTGACSVEKSCAELSPAMIASAQGASLLEGNLREFARLEESGHPNSTDALSRWAAEGLGRAGVPHVRTERLVSQTGKPSEIEVVVGEIRGREKPDEFVVLSAHLDARIPGETAGDDAADTAVLIDAARVIQASGSIPRRTIRILLFTGTQEGNPGSQAYVKAHREELVGAAAAVFISVANEPISGYSLSGRQDILAAVREALAPVGQLGVRDFVLDATLRPDSLDFLLEGIPTLVAQESLASHAPRVRADSGQLDAATIAELKRHVAIAALTAYALADTPQRVGPRQSRAEVEHLLQASGLAQEMKREGIWPSWENGERGLPRPN